MSTSGELWTRGAEIPPGPVDNSTKLLRYEHLVDIGRSGLPTGGRGGYAPGVEVLDKWTPPTVTAGVI